MLGVDAGGTFTDVVSVKDGVVSVTKVPSSRDHPAGPVVEGARRLGAAGHTVFNHASTMGLNSVITRRLPKVGFLTTEGHRDMLVLGRIWRPMQKSTDARWRRSFGDSDRPLVARYLRRGIRERVLANGSVLTALDEDQARRELEMLGKCGIEGLAICLINSYVDGAHEQRLKELAHEVLGDIPVSISSETSPLAKEYNRASTTVIDVLMKLIYGGYGEQLNRELAELGFDGDLNFADCAANLLPWQEALRQPYRIVFAGPAAGTISCQHLGKTIGEPNLICADVGGTSTDVSLVVNGEPFVSNTFELEHDMIINALSTEVSSVGAGGGSLVGVAPTGDITVGPGSAGANPGPACYQRGGTEPTVSDACLLMGIIDPKGFAGGQMELSTDLARRAFEQLDSPLSFEQRVGFSYRIAATNIAEEVTNVAIRHGVDPRDFSVVAYGAAGPMLLPAALETLNVKSVIVPPYPGLFSALGLLSTDKVFSDSRSAYLTLGPDTAEEVGAIFDSIIAGLRDRLGDEAESGLVKLSFDGRLYGQSWETPFVELERSEITPARIGEVIARFHSEYERRFSNRFEAIPVQGVTYRAQLIVPATKFDHAEIPFGDGSAPAPTGTRELRYLEELPVEANEYRREILRSGDVIYGPAIIQEDLCTTLVASRQRATVGRFGEIVIEREQERTRP